MSTPRITTIVPTYRRARLLKRAVLSVLNQSYPHLIVRILDNASGDDTEEMAQELMRLDARVQYHRHPENIGSLNNIIYGIDGITTDYFTILSDDDLLMPGFFEQGLAAHERGDVPPAFVATRVVVVDEAGQFADPWTHPHEARRLLPPEGIARCLNAGVSLPGVVYRTSAIRAIGMPRVSWWNWTESGWHALAAAKFPIAFCPEVGAIVFVHADSSSKRMSSMEFRVSWFAMLAEVRAAAIPAAVSRSWWTSHVLPVAYGRFLGTLIRLCSPDGSAMYERLGRLGVASGLNRFVVSGSIGLARAAKACGVGSLLNNAMDWTIRRQQASAGRSAASGGAPEDASISAASRVFSQLSQQAGLN